MSRFRALVLPAAVTTALVLAGSSAPVTATVKQQLPHTQQDLGPTAAAETITASVVLKVRRADALEEFVRNTQEPSSWQYHRFLSRQEFIDHFSPGPADIAIISRYLRQFGISVDEVYDNRLLLRVRGTADAFDKAFDLDMHDFVREGRRYHRPRHVPRIPLLLRELLVTIVGPNNEPQFTPRHIRASQDRLPIQIPHGALPPAGAIATGVPGDYTVGDVANRYHINPIYGAGIDGAGRTLGIITLADFLPSDAYAYWNLIGLSVPSNRITQIHVDGGAAFGADEGSGETSLDVEQSGGIAPGAAIRVYDAPNSDAGFTDAFYRAISDNVVDSLSVSWGLAEPFYQEAVTGVDATGQLLALHQIFLEAAAQGISVFAATGDNGAYDMNNAWNDPVDNVLTVDTPASDPAITAAGGTTTPVSLNAGPGTPTLTVPTERVWGWDYIENYLVSLFGPAYEHSAFPAGGGGGVSTFWARPYYQSFTDGMRKSEPAQNVVFGGDLLLKLPAEFRGRNLPDISLNADPFTGYIVVSSADGGPIDGYGGTSFVAPQLNGLSALYAQATQGRIGLWNPMLYRFQRVYGYGPLSPFVDITTGNNWFYSGVPGYEPGAGLGVINATKLLKAMVREGHPW